MSVTFAHSLRFKPHPWAAPTHRVCRARAKNGGDFHKQPRTNNFYNLTKFTGLSDRRGERQKTPPLVWLIKAYAESRNAHDSQRTLTSTAVVPDGTLKRIGHRLHPRKGWSRLLPRKDWSACKAVHRHAEPAKQNHTANTDI